MKKLLIGTSCVALLWIWWNIHNHWAIHSHKNTVSNAAVVPTPKCTPVSETQLGLDNTTKGGANMVFKDSVANVDTASRMINFSGDIMTVENKQPTQSEKIQVVNRTAKFSKLDFIPGQQLSFKTYKKPVIYEECQFGDSCQKPPCKIPFVYRACYYDTDCYLGPNYIFIPVVFAYDTFAGPLGIKADRNKGNGHGNTLTFDHCCFKKGVQFDWLPPDSNGRMRTALDSFSSIIFSNCTIKGVLSLAGNTFSKQHSIVFRNVSVDSLNLHGVILSGNYNIDLSNPSAIYIPYDPQPWSKHWVTDYVLAPFFEERNYYPPSLNLNHTDVNKITFDYRYFTLYFDDTATDDHQESVYRNLLDKYKKEVGSKNLEAVDVDYHDFQGGPINALSKLWWRCGYDKKRVFILTLIILVLFTVITKKYFEPIVGAYDIKGVTDKLKEGEVEHKWRLSFIYTLIVFVSPMLNWEDLKYDNWRATAYILVVYAYGLLILYFILNYIVAVK